MTYFTSSGTPTENIGYTTRLAAVSTRLLSVVKTVFSPQLVAAGKLWLAYTHCITLHSEQGTSPRRE